MKFEWIQVLQEINSRGPLLGLDRFPGSWLECDMNVLNIWFRYELTNLL